MTTRLSRARFSKLPVIITGHVKLVFCVQFQMGASKVLNYTVKKSAKETKWTLLEVRTHPPLSYQDVRETDPWEQTSVTPLRMIYGCYGHARAKTHGVFFEVS